MAIEEKTYECSRCGRKFESKLSLPGHLSWCGKDSIERRQKMSEAGTRRRPCSAETRAKIAAATRRRPPASAETRAKISAAQIGRKPTAQTRQRMSEAAKRRPPMSAETRRKIGDAAKKRWATPEDRQKIMKSLMGHPVSEETRRKIGEANRGKRISTQHKRQIGDANRGSIHSAEVKRKIGQASTEHWTKPKYRERIIQALCNRSPVVYQAVANKLRGAQSPHWKGGKLPYGSIWAGQRACAQNRDNYTCQRCGINKEDIGRHVSIHHIRPFREHRDNGLDNLISLCENCHRHCETHPADCPEPRKHWLLTAYGAVGTL